MGYVVGVSTGLWGITSAEEKEQLMSLTKKIFWGGFKGVNFSQIDIDSVNEFSEPYLDEGIKKMESIGMQYGIHAETAATVGEHTMPLESAIYDEYERAHVRLIEHIKGAGKIRAKYLLTHASELTPIPILATRELQSTKLADFWGRPLSALLDDKNTVAGKNKDGSDMSLLDWSVGQHFILEVIRGMRYEEDIGDYLDRAKHAYIEKEKKEPDEKWLAEKRKEIEKELHESKKKTIKQFVDSRDFTHGAERLAYFIVAKYMEIKKDPIWKGIVTDRGETRPFEKFYDQYEKWVPAVSAKYVWGHFNPRPESEMKKIKGVTHEFQNPKPLLEKFNFVFVFEPQMAKLGFEKHMRLHKITDIYWLVKEIHSKFVGIAFDIEHTLSGGWDPKQLVDELPMDGAGMVRVMHLGWPTPHVPAHVPIYLGSEAQYYIYEILYKLRKKGFDESVDRWLIFERGGGPDPVKDSTVALRKVVEFLRKDIPPKELPLDFYGVGEEGPEVSRQLVAVREHALDPLKGVLHVPEEEFGFLSTSVAQKGKLEEWKKAKLK